MKVLILLVFIVAAISYVLLNVGPLQARQKKRRSNGDGSFVDAGSADGDHACHGGSDGHGGTDLGGGDCGGGDAGSH